MKKLIFTLFLALIYKIGFAQVFQIDTLPKQGILLDKGWKFHIGDNPDWAKANFDDSVWESINPTLDVHDKLPQIPRPSGICWFRLHLNINNNVLKDPMALSILQVGASEIYENGILIRKYGRLSANPNEIEGFDPLNKPIIFNTKEDTSIVLAVRYTFQPNVLYTRLFTRQNPAIQILLNTAENAFIQDANWVIRNLNSKIIRIGCFFIFFLLFFSYFLNSPEQKTNLYFSIYAMLSILHELVSFPSNEVDETYLRYTIGINALRIGVFFLLTALYLLLNQKRTWVYWSILFVTLIGVISNFFYSGVVSSLIVTNIVNIEIVRISLKSIKVKKRGSWIITAGGIGLLVFWIGFALSFAFNFMFTPIFDTIYTYGDVLYNLAVLSIPVAVSVYLGLDIANTNLSLRQKIIEVEDLSAERQQILANQNEVLERQIEQRTAQLKASQNQLVQKEKLASLGELTAGIAHEIQNPLNFVNNFSELSVDLAQELKEEVDKPNINKELVSDLVDDLVQNQEKINLHGKRASSIVKGMLEHSRMGTGECQPTDINKLADEYLRLSYHGLRAKDSSFNADYELIEDPDLPKINIVSQDIGRVLLNLINNAFYAVNQRAKRGEADYQPKVAVSTSAKDNQLEIRVTDNGAGMPEATKAKIFQPFFTTKPTGEGTGLGLSLAYDIVTKGHGGTLEVETKEGEGTTFIVKLPFETHG